MTHECIVLSRRDTIEYVCIYIHKGSTKVDTEERVFYRAYREFKNLNKNGSAILEFTAVTLERHRSVEFDERSKYLYKRKRGTTIGETGTRSVETSGERKACLTVPIVI